MTYARKSLISLQDTSYLHDDAASLRPKLTLLYPREPRSILTIQRSKE